MKIIIEVEDSKALTLVNQIEKMSGVKKVKVKYKSKK